MPGSPRSPTDLLAHTLITVEEKSHSLWLLGILNEALVRTALNVTEHRKTPVLHSTVGCLPLPVPDSYEQRLLGYCKITPPPSSSSSLMFPWFLESTPTGQGWSTHYLSNTAKVC